MPNLATSGTYYWNSNRNTVINRALRIVGNTNPSSADVTNAAEALNDLVKEWQTDGMPLWKITIETPFAYTATPTYLIGVGATVNVPAPLKVLYAYNRTGSGSTQLDSPMADIISVFDYERLGNKNATGRPSLMAYVPPGPNTNSANGDNVGTIYVYPTPDAYSISNVTCGIVTQRPYADFTATTDQPDFPSSWINALKWGLADQMSYEYGLPFAERGMIEKKADKHKKMALEGATEETSLFIWPRPQYGNVDGSR